MWLLPFVKPIISNLFQKSPTHKYPHAPMPKDPLVRGQVKIDIEACIFCNICTRKCPADAISVDKQSKEWEISHFQCVFCGECIEVCPKKCLIMLPELAAASDVRTKESIKAIVDTEKSNA